SPGGWPAQLTPFEDHAVRAVVPSPDGATIVFAADRDGDEFHQLYVLDAGGGWPQALTDAAQVQHHLSAGSWSPDGRRLAYAANARSEERRVGKESRWRWSERQLRKKR